MYFIKGKEIFQVYGKVLVAAIECRNTSSAIYVNASLILCWKFKGICLIYGAFELKKYIIINLNICHHLVVNMRKIISENDQYWV